MANLPVPRSRRMVVAMRAEATYGTDIFAGTYTAADIIPAFDIRPSQPPQVIENLTQGGQLGRLPSIVNLPTAQVSFAMNLRGKGVAYSASIKPESDLPFRACALSSTFSGGVGAEIVTYAPTDTHESFTIYVVQETGTALKIVGAFGTFSLAMTAGGVTVARYTFSGQHAGEADVTFVAGALSGTPQYPVMKSAAFQIATENYAARIAQMGFDQNNVVAAVPSINAASALAGYIIADRAPRITMDPEAATLATFGWYTKFNAGTLMDCTFQTGTTLYNVIKNAFLNLQLVDKGWSTRDNLTAFPSTLACILASGNDDFSIVFA